MRRHKYGAKKTELDGIKFDSKKEAARYRELKLLERAGEIRDLRLQVPYELQPKFRKAGKTWRSVTYVADFVYQTKDGREVIEDVKGMRTDVYRLKRKLFEYKYPDKTITEI